MRRVLVSLAVLCLTAFAPAPLPRKDRHGADAVSLPALQGTWRLTHLAHTGEDGKHTALVTSTSSVRIAGSEWTFANSRFEGETLRITLDSSSKPVGLDFWEVGVREELVGRGIVRRRGDVLEVVYSFSSKLLRPMDFDLPPAGCWLMKLQRQR